MESGLARMFGREPGERLSSTSPSTTSRSCSRPSRTNFDVEGLLRGIYRYRAATEQRANKAQILASGVAMPSALKAAELLAADWDVAADVWSVTSWSELNRDGVAVARGRGCATRTGRPASPT